MGYQLRWTEVGMWETRPMKRLALGAGTAALSLAIAGL
jgi:hypothetical protein